MSTLRFQIGGLYKGVNVKEGKFVIAKVISRDADKLTILTNDNKRYTYKVYTVPMENTQGMYTETIGCGNDKATIKLNACNICS